MPDEAIGWPFILRLGRDYADLSSRFNFCQTLLADEMPGQQADWPDDAWHKYGADWQLLASGKPIPPHHQVVLALRQHQWVLTAPQFRNVLRTGEQRLEQFPDDVQLVNVSNACKPWPRHKPSTHWIPT